MGRRRPTRRWQRSSSDSAAEFGRPVLSAKPTASQAISRAIDDACARWELAVDGARRSGEQGVVLAVHQHGRPLALKVVSPVGSGGPAADEHLALRHWDGRGAVRLVAADPRAGLMLLERLDPSRSAAGLPLPQACTVIGELLGQLQVPAPPSIRAAQPWLSAEFDDACDGVPRRFLHRARGLLVDLPTPPQPRLLHFDLHFDNVLAHPQTNAWTAIDPQPLAGHPGLDLQPVLRNRLDDYPSGSGFRWEVRYRFSVVCEAAGLDEDEARGWAYVRAALDAVWADQDHDHDALSLHIALLKALDG